MSEDVIVLVTTIIYLLLGGIPLIIFLDRGRQSGRVTSKLCATLLTLFLVGLPLFAIRIVFRQRFTSWSLEYWGLFIVAFSVVWLAVYAGPMGAGWTGKWRHYVYPTRKKEKEQRLTAEPRVPARPSKSFQLIHSWRFWTGMVVLTEIVMLIGGGLIINNNLLTIIGIVVAPIHLAVFLAIWHWKQEKLKEKGWRW